MVEVEFYAIGLASQLICKQYPKGWTVAEALEGLGKTDYCVVRFRENRESEWTEIFD